MEKRIVVDSGCDMTPQMLESMGVVSVPMVMMLGNREFRDDGTLDLAKFLLDMKNTTEKASSAAPAPQWYQEAIESLKDAFVVTLSSKLSASYENAVNASRQAIKNGKGAIHIFDSKSASAGQTLVTIKLYEMIKEGLTKEHIINSLTQFIDNMKTYFVLENYNNLVKNGRLGRVTCSLINILNIKLVMGSDGHGEIKLFEKCRGAKRALQQLADLIESSGKDTNGGNLVITHCNNHISASDLSEMIKSRFNFRNIYIVPARGISTIYADDGGIVMAF